MGAGLANEQRFEIGEGGPAARLGGRYDAGLGDVRGESGPGVDREDHAHSGRNLGLIGTLRSHNLVGSSGTGEVDHKKSSSPTGSLFLADSIDDFESTLCSRHRMLAASTFFNRLRSPTLWIKLAATYFASEASEMSEQGETDFEVEVVRLGLPLSMKTGQACRVMDCGPTKLRELVAEGKIDGRKRDKDLVIRTASILKYNAELPPAEFAIAAKKAKSGTNAATN
jgi:hypothetical protein